MIKHLEQFKEYLRNTNGMTEAGIRTYISRLGAFVRQGITSEIDEETLNNEDQLQNYLTAQRVGYTNADLQVAGRAYIRFIASYEPIEISGLTISASSLPQNPDEIKRYLARIRTGQARYRLSLINKFNGNCCVTGSTVMEILSASHIKPYSVCSQEEQYDPENGLLLTPQFDKLFDRGLITFENDGAIRVSGLLSQPNIDILGIIGKRIIVPLSVQTLNYLEYHRSEVFVE